MNETNKPAEPLELTVPAQPGGERIDRFLAMHLPQFSRSRLQQLIRAGAVTLNGQPPRPREPVRTGDVIRITEPSVQKTDILPEAIPLHVLFEDKDVIVLNKPPGLVVHPGAGHREHTLVNALLNHCHSLSGIGGEERPGIVHRLDKDTSGCVVVAKNDEAHRELSAQFAARTVEKIYLALVAGNLRKPTGSIEEKIGRHPVNRQQMSVNARTGRAARTDYRVVAGLNGISLVECRLHSGRTHQIRVHFHHIGHPVLGDKVYGAKSSGKFPRQMLHAWKLGFNHPRSGEWQRFEAAPPDDFQQTMASAGLIWQGSGTGF